MKTEFCAAWLVVLMAGSVAGCAHGEGVMYLEPSIPRDRIQIERVAIVPNRLPLNLQNAEYWTKRNWEVVAQQFREHGFQVIDYQVSVDAFQQGALPVEDTKSSRDKYADLAKALNVDMVVIPYYGTFGSASNILIATTVNYASVTTLQFYFAGENDFFARVDASGKWSYTSGVLVTVGLGLTLGGSLAPQSGDGSSMQAQQGLQLAGLVIMGVGLFTDLIVSAISDDSKWGSAFSASIEEGLHAFFKVFPAPVGRSRRALAHQSDDDDDAARPEPPRPKVSAAPKEPSAAPKEPAAEPPPPPPISDGRTRPAAVKTGPHDWAVALEVTGDDASDHNRLRCMVGIDRKGVVIDDNAYLHLTIHLQPDANSMKVSNSHGRTLLESDLPAQRAESLCEMAIEQISALPKELRSPPQSDVREGKGDAN